MVTVVLEGAAFMMNESENDSADDQSVLIVHDFMEYPSVRYIVITVHVLAIVIAVTGNASIIFCVLKNKALRKNVTTYLVFNLALCELFSAGVYQPLSLMDIVIQFHFGQHAVRHTVLYCQCISFFMSFTAAVAFFTIAAICSETYLLLCHPLRAKGLLSVGKTKRIMVVIWVTSFFLVLPNPIFFSVVQDVHLMTTNVTVCLNQIGGQSVWGRAYLLTIFIVYYVIPVLLVVASCTMIYFTLHRNLYGCRIQDPNTKRLMRQRKSLSTTMLVIAVMFAVCNGPYFFTYFYNTFYGNVVHNPFFIVIVLEFLPLISSSCYPIIFTSRAHSVRGAFTSLAAAENESDRNEHSGPNGSSVKSRSIHKNSPDTRFIHNNVPDCHPIQTGIDNGQPSCSIESKWEAEHWINGVQARGGTKV